MSATRKITTLPGGIRPAARQLTRPLFKTNRCDKALSRPGGLSFGVLPDASLLKWVVTALAVAAVSAVAAGAAACASARLFACLKTGSVVEGT